MLNLPDKRLQELLTPLQLGPYQLSNRLVMGSQSRMRAIDYCPQPIMETYYAQRSSAGLIISEPTLINRPVIDLPSCPGLFMQSQVEAWRRVTQAVHQRGGRIFVQLWHEANLDYLYEDNSGLADVYPPDVRPADNILQRMEVIQQFRRAAQYAIAAEFDGVEIHGALRSLTRSLAFSPPSSDCFRAEGIPSADADLLSEIVEGVSAIWDCDRVGVFLSPRPAFSEYQDPYPEGAFYTIADTLNQQQIAYLHLAEALPDQSFFEDPTTSIVEAFRPIFRGAMIVDGQDDLQCGLQQLIAGKADLISLCQYFVANPDLINRIVSGRPTNAVDKTTLYKEGERGYIDYPDC
ncbi:MAG: hypothetical protein AAGD25_13965 [Cyanobacteria bacterium P01_F01_bin.150]